MIRGEPFCPAASALDERLAALRPRLASERSCRRETREAGATHHRHLPSAIRRRRPAWAGFKSLACAGDTLDSSEAARNERGAPNVFTQHLMIRCNARALHAARGSLAPLTSRVARQRRLTRRAPNG